MGFRKKTSKTLEKAQTRVAGIKSIDPALDLGNGNTAAAYQTDIDSCLQTLEDYNAALSAADEKKNLFQAAELQLKNRSEAMLIGVAAKYGKNSNEYEKAGGTRKSEKKKPKKKTTTATPKS